MKILEKKEIKDNNISNISKDDIEKILISKRNYENIGKTYDISDAYNLGLSKLDF